MYYQIPRRVSGACTVHLAEQVATHVEYVINYQYQPLPWAVGVN